MSCQESSLGIAGLCPTCTDGGGMHALDRISRLCTDQVNGSSWPKKVGLSIRNRSGRSLSKRQIYNDHTDLYYTAWYVTAEAVLLHLLWFANFVRTQANGSSPERRRGRVCELSRPNQPRRQPPSLSLLLRRFRLLSLQHYPTQRRGPTTPP